LILIQFTYIWKQRFVPSEFGLDVDRQHVVEPGGSALDLKVKIRRTVEAEGIPYTFVVANAFAGYSLPTLGQQNVNAPPRDKVSILGDGNVKGIHNIIISYAHSLCLCSEF